MTHRLRANFSLAIEGIRYRIQEIPIDGDCNMLLSYREGIYLLLGVGRDRVNKSAVSSKCKG